MLQGKRVALAASVIVVAIAPFLMGGLDQTSNFQQRVLDAQNLERQDVGVPAMHWNPDLAQDAQAWADYLARTGKFEHAPDNPGAVEGENLWAGTKGYFSPEAMVDAWVREKRNFKPGTFPDN